MWMQTRLLFALAMLVMAIEGQAQGVLPDTMNYQGTLLDSAGDPVADGDYDVEFRIFSQATGGTAVWGPHEFDGTAGTGHSAMVSTIDGRYNVVLGPVDSSSRSIVSVFNGSVAGSDTRYVEVTVGGTTILPRQRILSAPYALASLGMVPIGSIVAHHPDINGAAGISALRDAGFALCDGTTAAAQGIEDAAITGTLPDLNVGDGTGRFLRGTTGSTGELQDDQLQGHIHSLPDHSHTATAMPHTHTYSVAGHTHTITTGEGDGGSRDKASDGDSSGGQHTAETEGAETGVSLNTTTSNVTIGTSSIAIGDPAAESDGTPRFGAETRPKSTTVLWIIRVR